MDEQAEMFAYYDARADSYDEFYQGQDSGRAGVVSQLAAEYPVDTAAISDLVGAFIRGDVVDLACGTGYWLTAYGASCGSVTLVDQSAAVLARCGERLRSLGLEKKARIVQGDLFTVELPEAGFDAAVVGFLVSHLSDTQTAALFRRLRSMLRPKGTLAIIDSHWSEARKPYRQRDSFERRVLPDGRPFSIRKRYFDQADLETLFAANDLQVKSVYAGKVFIAAVARGV